MRLLPELHSTNRIVDFCRSENIRFRISWNRATEVVIFVGELEIQPWINHLKTWLNGLCIGSFKMNCEGEFLTNEFRLLLISQKNRGLA